MDLQLEGRRALVTGGSSGIGKAVARQLALEGVDVVLAARNAERLNAVALELSRETGRKIVGISADTSDNDSVAALMNGAIEALGGVDILVNSAAKVAGQTAPKLTDITDDLFWGELNVKVLGYLRTAREAAPHMIANGWGRIINISGLAARQTGYVVSSIRNVSVAALTKNLADELGPKGVNVTVVHPGYTRTEAVDATFLARAEKAKVRIEEIEKSYSQSNSVGRLITAAEVADVVAMLASPRSVAINGDAIAVGGGARGAIYY